MNSPATAPTATTSVSISVPDELQAQMAAWEDGKQYSLTVEQTGPMQFDLVSAEEAPGESDEGETQDDVNPGSAADTSNSTIPTKNPAVAALVMQKRGMMK